MDVLFQFSYRLVPGENIKLVQGSFLRVRKKIFLKSDFSLWDLFTIVKLILGLKRVMRPKPPSMLMTGSGITSISASLRCPL